MLAALLSKLAPSLSATIGGKKTNRVRVKRAPRTVTPSKATVITESEVKADLALGAEERRAAECVVPVRARTNRVPVKRRAMPAKQAKAAYRKDPSTRGLQVAVVCISLPVGELNAIDDACLRVQMARSHLLREAAKWFIERLSLATT